jgi:hypothetical protein
MNTFYSSIFALALVSTAPSLCVAQDGAPPSSAAVTAKAYSTTGSLDGVTFTVNGLKRNANGTLTVSVKLQGTQGKPVRREAIGFSGDSPWSQDYKLLDLVNKKRYSMLEDSNGRCLCTHITDEELSGLSSGKAKDINIKFPMPPADLPSITVELPHSEPIEDVPIIN